MEENPPVWLRLSTNKVRVLIEVWDGNIGPPEPRELNDGLPAFGDEGGRGLFLVAMLSDRWNWYLTQSPKARSSGVNCLFSSQAVVPEPLQILYCREGHPQAAYAASESHG